MSDLRAEERVEPHVVEAAVAVEDVPVAGSAPDAEEAASVWRDDAAEGAFGAPVSRARQAYATRAVRRKDHVYAGLFAIFLGLFGMHKFYLGYNNAAFIMLSVSIIGSIVSLGIAAAVVWVIAIIEGIIYLTKPQAEFDRIYVNNTREWF